MLTKATQALIGAPHQRVLHQGGLKSRDSAAGVVSQSVQLAKQIVASSTAWHLQDMLDLAYGAPC